MQKKKENNNNALVFILDVSLYVGFFCRYFVTRIWLVLISVGTIMHTSVYLEKNVWFLLFFF